MGFRKRKISKVTVSCYLRESTVWLFFPPLFCEPRCTSWGTNGRAVWPRWTPWLEQSSAALSPFGGEGSCWVLHAGQASPARRREGASLPRGQARGTMCAMQP